MLPGPEPTPTTDLALDDIDLGRGEFWDRSEDDKEGAFALLRRERPVSWHSEPPLDNTDIEVGPGFWAVVRYADVMHVSRNPALFISGRGSNIPDWPPEVLEFLGSMINMDDPRHTKLRLIVNRGFTPHQIGELTQAVDDRARAIVDEVADRGECDFVLDIASRLPLDIICNMLGIPREDHEFVFEQTNLVLGVGDPEVAPTLDIAFMAAHQLWDYAQIARPGSPRPSTRRHHDEAHAGRGRRASGSRPPSSVRSSCCSPPRATRRLATRSATGCWR